MICHQCHDTTDGQKLCRRCDRACVLVPGLSRESLERRAVWAEKHQPLRVAEYREELER